MRRAERSGVRPLPQVPGLHEEGGRGKSMNPIVWSCGMGVNSAAMLVGFVKYGMSYDLAMFADTGGESDGTYAYQSVINDYARKYGFPPIMRVWKKNDDNSPAPTLEQDCLNRKALPSIAYGRFKSCSDHYKIRPQRKVIEQWKPALEAWERGEKVMFLIGFDAEESHRTLDYGSAKYESRYPLVEWGWDREDCEREVLAAGLPLPPKSSCFFCPNMRPHEIIALNKLEPDKIARALAMEANAELTTIRGLGRKWSWRDVLDADDAQIKMFQDPPEQTCACIG